MDLAILVLVLCAWLTVAACRQWQTNREMERANERDMERARGGRRKIKVAILCWL